MCAIEYGLLLINGNTLRTWNGMIVSGSALAAQGGVAGYFSVKIEGKKGMAMIALEDIWAATSEVVLEEESAKVTGLVQAAWPMYLEPKQRFEFLALQMDLSDACIHDFSDFQRVEISVLNQITCGLWRGKER